MEKVNRKRQEIVKKRRKRKRKKEEEERSERNSGYSLVDSQPMETISAK